MFEYKIIFGRPDSAETKLNEAIEDGYEFVAQSSCDYCIHITLRKLKVTH